MVVELWKKEDKAKEILDGTENYQVLPLTEELVWFGQTSCNCTKKLQLRKKVAIAQKSCNCAKKLQLCKKVCRFLRRNSTGLQKVAIVQKSCNCTKKLQLRKKVAIVQKSCKCAKKLQLPLFAQINCSKLQKIYDYSGLHTADSPPSNGRVLVMILHKRWR
jgi:hypothetical protein